MEREDGGGGKGVEGWRGRERKYVVCLYGMFLWVWFRSDIF